MAKEQATVWATKYALTTGIEKLDVEISGGMVIERAPRLPRYFHGEGREWHRSWEGALAHAEKMRADKIASLRKSITKLEKMTWKAP